MSHLLSPKRESGGALCGCYEPTQKEKKCVHLWLRCFLSFWLTFINNSLLFRVLNVLGSFRNPLVMFLIKLHSKLLI